MSRLAQFLKGQRHWGARHARVSHVGSGAAVPVVKGITTRFGLVQDVVTGQIQSVNMDNTSTVAGTFGDGTQPFITDLSGRVTGPGNNPMTVLDSGGAVFNVKAKKYGIVGDKVHDDTQGVAQAIADGIAAGAGTIVLPPIPSQCRITGTIPIAPQAGQTWASVNIIAQGASAIQGQIQGYFFYDGPSNTPIFTIANAMYSCIFQGCGVNIEGSQTNVQVFDIPGGTAIGYLAFVQCNPTFGSNTTNCIGWRLGQTLSNASNIYGTVWDQCSGNGGNVGTSGNMFIQIGGPSAYASVCRDCSMEGYTLGVCCGPVCSYLQNSIGAGDVTMTIGAGSGTAGNHLAPGTGSSANTTVLFPTTGIVQIGSEQIAYSGKTANQLTGLTRGYGGTTPASHSAGNNVNQYVPNQGVYAGVGAFTYSGGGGGGNVQDFYLQQVGTWYKIENGRFEGQLIPSNRFISTSPFGVASGTQQISIDNVQLAVYTPPGDGHGLIWTPYNSTVSIRGSWITVPNGTQLGPNNPLISNYGASGTGGAFKIARTTIQAIEGFWSWGQTNQWPVDLDTVQLISSDGRTYVKTIDSRWIVPTTLTDNPGGTVTLDVTDNGYFILPMTGTGNARTLALANSYPGQRFRLLAQQSSGGTNAIVWPTIRWAGGSQPTLSAASKWDEIEIKCVAANTYVGIVTAANV